MTEIELGAAIRDFTERRDWGRHHRPRSVLLALMAEVGELAELVQWVPDEDVAAWVAVSGNRQALESEIADVYIYLACFAQALGVDLEKCVREKLAVNERRFPVKDPGPL